jgi:hypothetical protein
MNSKKKKKKTTKIFVVFVFSLDLSQNKPSADQTVAFFRFWRVEKNDCSMGQ